MVTFPAVSLAGNETNPFYLECQTVHMYMMDVCQSPTQDIEPFGYMWQYLLCDALRGINPNSDEKVSQFVRDKMSFIWE